MHHIIECAVTTDMRRLAEEYIDALENSRSSKNKQRAADIADVFEAYVDKGKLAVPRELNRLERGISELKAGDVRLPFFEVDGTKSGAIRLTHGFLKRGEKAPKPEINKAIWVRTEDGKVDPRAKSV